MKIAEYLKKIQCMQSLFLKYINDEDNVEENWQNLVSLITKENCIKDNQHDLELLLRLIKNISNNHHRSAEFFPKIEKILLLVKDEIKKHFSNTTVFNIFKSNKRILLFLIEEDILIFNEFIADFMTRYKYIVRKYPHYFFNKIEDYIKDGNLKREIIDEINQSKGNIEEKKKIGENDKYICQLIRDDNIEDFIIHMRKHDIFVNSFIENSIFETNSFLLSKKVTLIEYAAFFGSFQIFKYLYLNNSEITKSLCIYAIHGNSQFIIDYIKDNSIECDFEKVYEESIKCHHNSALDYIIYLYNKEQNNFYFSEKFITKIFKSYNFTFIDENLIDQKNFYLFCQYSYCTFVDFILKNEKIDINEYEILNIYCFIQFNY